MMISSVGVKIKKSVSMMAVIVPREWIFHMHVTISHYNIPGPQRTKYSTWGQETRQLSEQGTWMGADSQWGGAEGARRARTSSPLRELTGSQPSACTKQPLDRNAYSNQTSAQASPRPSASWTRSLRRVRNALTQFTWLTYCDRDFTAIQPKRE